MHKYILFIHIFLGAMSCGFLEPETKTIIIILRSLRGEKSSNPEVFYLNNLNINEDFYFFLLLSHIMVFLTRPSDAEKYSFGFQNISFQFLLVNL